IEIAFAEGSDECWIIGGSQIYEMFLDRVEEIHVTKVHVGGNGDVSFPNWDRSNWSEDIIERTIEDEDNEHATTYSIWTKS
ncbi:MAG TPA: dihydrofolate reductase, partial [Candidatus Thalassarchaeaceae archaeon]|nr:dihydrofolate reductase [Candidatus Thalassarchaeaceae archaeon]